jgi:putative DNA primase/helicase
MDFLAFCRAHGVIIDRLPPVGVWKRYATQDKPHRQNGAVKFMGDHGFVLDWGAMSEADTWHANGDSKVSEVDRAAMARRAREAAEEIRRKQAKAAARAKAIMAQTRPGTHPYLAAKGFPEETGAIWRDEDEGDDKLCIPMYVGGDIVGVQTISSLPARQLERRGELVDVPNFEKRFLPGQRIDLATFTWGQRGPLLLCEGVATGITIRKAMESLRMPFRLVVAFNAGNMRKVARAFEDERQAGIVVADNDMPSKQYPEAGGAGIAAAKAIGWPYWASDRAPEDANDLFVRRGLFALTRGLKPLVLRQHTRRA